MKMSEFKASAVSQPDAAPKRSGYAPPHLRKAVPKQDEEIKFTDSDFPGLVPCNGPTPVAPSINFKQSVMNFLEKEKLDQEERNRLPELDPKKMNRAQLEAGGWAVLSMDLESVKAAAERLNSTTAQPYSDCYGSLTW
jgi:hypothetical protein